MTTKEIEHIAYKHLWKQGWYGVFECAIPREIQNKYHRERVDMLTYETTGIYRAYEIKVSYSDFHSKAALSWIGNYNYYLLPIDLYNKVKNEIPDGIGCWVAYDSGFMECKKKPKRMELKCPSENMMFALMQALSREYKKYRKILEKEDKKSESRKEKSRRKTK